MACTNMASVLLLIPLFSTVSGAGTWRKVQYTMIKTYKKTNLGFYNRPNEMETKKKRQSDWPQMCPGNRQDYWAPVQPGPMRYTVADTQTGPVPPQPELYWEAAALHLPFSQSHTPVGPRTSEHCSGTWSHCRMENGKCKSWNCCSWIFSNMYRKNHLLVFHMSF